MRHRQVGIWEHDRVRATPGFTIIAPLHSKGVYLIGMEGEIRHVWQTPLHPGSYGRVLAGGNLLWAGQTPDGPRPGGGKGGLLQEYDWDGNLVWEHRDDNQHHDFRRLANGNTIYIGWERMTPEATARVAGAEPGR